MSPTPLAAPTWTGSSSTSSPWAGSRIARGRRTPGSSSDSPSPGPRPWSWPAPRSSCWSVRRTPPSPCWTRCAPTPRQPPRSRSATTCGPSRVLISGAGVGESECADRGDDTDDDGQHSVDDLLAVEERRHEVAPPGAGRELRGDEGGDQGADDRGADARADLLSRVVERGADRGPVGRHRVDQSDGADGHDGAEPDGHHDHADRDRGVPMSDRPRETEQRAAETGRADQAGDAVTELLREPL